MASTPGPSLAHRSVANIRIGAGGGSPSGPGTAGAGTPGVGGAPVSPHTPVRAGGMSSAFASPSTMRAEEDTIVIDMGSRRLRVGFAGDPAPKATLEFGPDHARRLGDFRHWDPPAQHQQPALAPWGDDHELWTLDVRGLDLGLVADKLERGLREAFATYLLIDSRPRKVVLTLPPMMPVPLLSTTLDTVFGSFQAPVISLLSSPVSAAFAAGVRSALVVDLGWHEAVVTTIYEYREVACTRSVRAGKALVRETHRLLARALAHARAATGDDGASAAPDDDSDDGDSKRVVAFNECEDVVARVVWCKPVVDDKPSNSDAAKEEPSSDGLTTVAEQDESDAEMPPPPPPKPQPQPVADPVPETISIPLTSTSPPATVTLPFEQLSEPCERAFFRMQCPRASFDDHELPLHLLVYEHLAALPMDVRSVAMSRIIFTGGCSAVLGLRGRVFDEVDSLARHWGWDIVRGKAVDKRRSHPKRDAGASSSSSSKESNGSGATKTVAGNGDSAGAAPAPAPAGQEEDGVWHDAANAVPAPDPIEAHMRRQQQQQQQSQQQSQQSGRQGGSSASRKQQLADPPEVGDLRVVESLGPWAGASLLSQLRVPAIATVDRDLWLQQGAAGASRASEVDLKAQHRSSTRPGEFISRASAGGAANTNWTLGVWGTLQ